MLTDEIKLKFSFLNDLSHKSLQLLQKELKTHSFAEKTNIIFKGDQVGGVYLVSEGSLRVYNIDMKGRETTLYTIMPGESCLLALNCVFSDLLYPAWVSVDEPDTKVFVIPASIYKQLYNSEKSVRDFSFNILSARVFDLMTTLEEVTMYDLDQRLASFLVRKANNEGIVQISHQEIASHLGTAREVVSRLLKQFEKEELIKTSRGNITLLSPNKLASRY